MSNFLENAIQVHVGWKFKLLAAINANDVKALDRTKVCADCHCDLGKWIHGDGKHFETVTGFKELREAHRKFHLSIGGILDLVTAGKLAEAKAALSSGDFHRFSTETVNHITKLKQNAAVTV